MKRLGSSWWILIQLGALAALFIWLRWYSPFWQNRWIGFSLGLALVLPSFASRERVRQQLDFARKYDLSKRVTVLLAVSITWASLRALKGFLVGPPFFSASGARAASDDGFFGVLLCMTALHWLYASWLVLRKSSDQSSQNPATPINHG